MSIQISKFGTSGSSTSKSFVVDNSILNETVARKKEDAKINEELKIQSAFDGTVAQQLSTLQQNVLDATNTANEVYSLQEGMQDQLNHISSQFGLTLINESKDRKNADTAIQTQLNALLTTDTDVKNQLNILSFADTSLQTQITSEIKNRTDAIADEAQLRTDADTLIRTDVNALFGQEAKTRYLADASLQTQIDSRALQSSLDDEAKARADADTTIQTQITSLQGTHDISTNQIDSPSGTLYLYAGYGVEISGECKTAQLVVTSGATLHGVIDVQGILSLGNRSSIIGADDIETKTINGDAVLTKTYTDSTYATINQFNTLTSQIPTSVSGTLTVVFNSTANGGTMANVSAKYIIMFNTVVLFQLSGFACNVGTVAKDYLLSQPVPSLLKPSTSTTNMVSLRKNGLTDAVGKLTFANSCEFLLEDFDSTAGYFQANGIGAGMQNTIQFCYMKV